MEKDTLFQLLRLYCYPDYEVREYRYNLVTSSELIFKNDATDPEIISKFKTLLDKYGDRKVKYFKTEMRKGEIFPTLIIIIEDAEHNE